MLVASHECGMQDPSLTLGMTTLGTTLPTWPYELDRSRRRRRRRPHRDVGRARACRRVARSERARRWRHDRAPRLGRHGAGDPDAAAAADGRGVLAHLLLLRKIDGHVERIT